ncbi:flagellar biosynthetic protein FliO [Undibacterium sp. TJN19]|uniref:flagellar biosynthetic protein FliO n=1 Tax=Undibacterium sp. TJN19 TaxID=3413055 RepID=UPI003BF3B637
MRNRYFYGPVIALALSCNALAAENSVPSPSVGLLQIITGLMLVLGLVVVAAWLMKRLGPMTTGNKIPVKIIGGINVGNRERVMVVEIADQWLILGVTANSINNLGSMPKQEDLLPHPAQPPGMDPFSAWLKRTVDKRTADRSETK